LKNRDLSLKGSFKVSDIPNDAQETCRNWFFKVAGVRDLVPRVYVELGILKAQRFVDDNGILKTLTRLSGCIRGIGDPLVASYARCYLARRGLCCFPTANSHNLNSLHDLQLSLFRQLSTPRHEEFRKKENLSVKDFMYLVKPAMTYLLETVGSKADKPTTRKVLETYSGHCNKSAMLLEGIIRAFPAEHIMTNIGQIIKLIKDADLSDVETASGMYAALGTVLVAHPPPTDKKLNILNELWKDITKISEPAEYIEAAEVYIEFVLKNFGTREADIFLQDVMNHVTGPERPYEKLQPPLRRIVEKVLDVYTDFTQVIGMSNFMPLLDLFQGEIRTEIAQGVVGAFVKMPGTTSDQVVISTVSGLAKVMHNSIDALSLIDHQRTISEHINKFINKVEFGTDLEKHLNFFVECRAAFLRLEPVKYALVLGSLELANRTHRLLGGRHTKKTIAFVKACLAFAHITIPSLEDVLQRMQLFILSGQMALMNQLLAQADAFFKAAIVQIRDVPLMVEDGIGGRQVPTGPKLVSVLSQFCSALVVVPGHPDPKHGPFHLINGLITMVGKYEWEELTAALNKSKVYIAMLPLFSALAQVRLPYHIERLESNDSLYALSDSYNEELKNIVNSVLEKVLSELSLLKQSEIPAMQQAVPETALDLFNTLVGHAMMDHSTTTLTARLYNLASKCSTVDKKHLRNSLATVAARAAKDSTYQELHDKIKA